MNKARGTMQFLFRSQYLPSLRLVTRTHGARAFSTPAYHELDESVSLEKLTSSHPRLLAYFTAAWCGPCRAIAPNFSALATKHANVKFVKIDVDDNADEAQKVRPCALLPCAAFARPPKLRSNYADAPPPLPSPTSRPTFPLSLHLFPL